MLSELIQAVGPAMTAHWLVVHTPADRNPGFILPFPINSIIISSFGDIIVSYGYCMFTAFLSLFLCTYLHSGGQTLRTSGRDNARRERIGMVTKGLLKT